MELLTMLDAPADAAAPVPDLALDDITRAGTVVEFSVAAHCLAQTYEWTEGRYRRISWPNILPPDWSCDMGVEDAMVAISESVRLPDFCINQ
jgi:hypothetical protein